MALEGSLRDFGLADILQLIFFQRKTGVLALEGKLDKIRLLFIEGNITGAESKRRIEANRMGKVLVKKGLLREEELQAVLEEQRSSRVRLGNILIKKGLVRKEDIQEILIGQIKETVIQIFNWKEGTYEFTPQAVPVDRDIPVSIDTQHLLMEGLRIVDEWTMIEGKITLDTVFIKRVDSAGGLTDEEEDIFSLVDGENDVSTIIDISGKDDFTVSKTLVALIEKGHIEQKEIVPVITEIIPKAPKKSGISSQILTALVIVAALFFSIASVFFDSGLLIQRYRASQDIDNLRFSIETFRLKYGAFPETLDMVSTKSDPWGKPFIYRQNVYTFIIISAGMDGQEGTSDDIY
jgi:predicted transcriptional regulator